MNMPDEIWMHIENGALSCHTRAISPASVAFVPLLRAVKADGRIATLEAALRLYQSAHNASDMAIADKTAQELLPLTLETKAKQFAPIDDGTICSNCTKTIGYHYQTAEGDLFCEVPKETKGDANG